MGSKLSRAPPQQKSSPYDIRKELGIEVSEGFFCEGCLDGKRLAERSPNPRYCQSCYDFLFKETQQSSVDKDYWDGAVFVHYGKGYTVKPSGQTVCIGPYPPPEKQKPKKAVSDVPQNPLEKPPGGKFKGDKIKKHSNPHTPKNPDPSKTKLIKVDKMPRKPPGRKKVDVSLKVIKNFVGAGYGSKVIAKELNKGGIEISYKTIQRRIKELQGKLI